MTIPNYVIQNVVIKAKDNGFELSEADVIRLMELMDQDQASSITSADLEMLQILFDYQDASPTSGIPSGE